MSWREYEEGLLQRVTNLHARLHSGAYRATPSRRVFIPKADVRLRPLGKPETFDFLGFTHCCSTNRSGGFQILRLTVKKRMRATLLAIRDELKRRRHEPVRVVGQWLRREVRSAS